MHLKDRIVGKQGFVSICVITALSMSLGSAQEPIRTPAAGSLNQLIGAFNEALSRNDTAAFSNLFLADADLWFGGEPAGKGYRAIQSAVSDRGIWSEVTPGRLDDASLRLISPDVALIDAKYVQYGSMIGKRAAPVLLVVKREAGEWRIVSMRFSSVALGLR